MFEPQNKIILTGYRATGKSTVGRALAAHLGLDFVDLDVLLAERAGGSIEEIVSRHGWDHFRNLERDLLAEMVERSGLVLSTGGGAILHQHIWLGLKQTGLVVWLAADIDTICRRLRSDHNSARQRPSLTGEDIEIEVARVLAEREPCYAKGSHLTIDTSAKSTGEIVAEIEGVLADEAFLRKIEFSLPDDHIYC